ncbi:MAG: hypothetical protein J7M34_07270, partial [Anaerolineae bacterium]|nr:hypothetical protein [Anaerolineae bacterium]
YYAIHDHWRDVVDKHPFRWPEMKDAPRPSLELGGYTFDWVNDEALAHTAASERRLQVGAQTYHAIVLDHVRYLPLETAKRLHALAGAGVPLIILGDPPQRVPGLAGGSEANARLRSLFADLLSRDDVRVYRSMEAYRAAGGLPPDVVVDDPKDAMIWWAHRRVEGADVYFIPHPAVTQLRYPIPYRDGNARPSAPTRLRLRLRVTERAPQLWDAESGTMWALPACDDGAYTHLELTFEPNRAHVIVFPPAGVPNTAPPRPSAGGHEMAITGPWRITLPDGTVEEWVDLRDWRDDPRLRDFSGTLSYLTTFELPEGLPPGPAFLDLGRVEVTAEVRVNGEYAGVRLWAPYRFQVDRWLRAGHNEIEVRVSNLLYNAVQGRCEREGTRPIPGLRPGEWEQVLAMGLVDPVAERRPSGLLGPVRLRW